MSVPKSILNAKGSWFGKSKLHLSYLPPEKRVSESGSYFHVETDSKDKYATLTYTWEHEGKREEGTMIVAMDNKTKEVEIGWTDSWHQNTAILHLKGKELSDSSLKTKGDWKAGDEVWGWTIAFELSGDELTMKMEVVTPKGEAEWAVEANYKRN